MDEGTGLLCTMDGGPLGALFIAVLLVGGASVVDIFFLQIGVYNQAMAFSPTL